MTGGLDRADHATLTPSAWIERFASLVQSGARVLDVAAGHGRHARFFAARGAQVLAIDRDREALEELRGVPGIEVRVADLEAGTWPLAGEQFDAIVVVNYLHRPTLQLLLAALADGGALLYETFAEGNERHGRPSNPAFLLRRNELLELAYDRLTIVAFEQGEVAGERSAVVERLAALGRARRWPPPLR